MITYDATRAQTDTQPHWFIHTLGALVQASLDAGLRLVELHGATALELLMRSVRN